MRTFIWILCTLVGVSTIAIAEPNISFTQEEAEKVLMGYETQIILSVAKYQLFISYLQELSEMKFDGDRCVDPKISSAGCTRILNLEQMREALYDDLYNYQAFHKLKGGDPDWVKVRQDPKAFESVKAELAAMLREGINDLKRIIDHAAEPK